MSDARRLEKLWGGRFGDDYIDRNREGHDSRGETWRMILDRWPAQRILEVGCNIGANIRHIAQRSEAWGIDVHHAAVAEMMSTTNAVGGVVASARQLPFPDESFDLTLTAGVLIHQPPSSLQQVMEEVVRCSARWVLAAEYVDEETVEVPYRGESGALFRRDYPRLYRELFPQLTEVARWFEDEGSWDRVTFAVFEKAA